MHGEHPEGTAFVYVLMNSERCTLAAKQRAKAAEEQSCVTLRLFNHFKEKRKSRAGRRPLWEHLPLGDRPRSCSLSPWVKTNKQLVTTTSHLDHKPEHLQHPIVSFSSDVRLFNKSEISDSFMTPFLKVPYSRRTKRSKWARKLLMKLWIKCVSLVPPVCLFSWFFGQSWLQKAFDSSMWQPTPFLF